VEKIIEDLMSEIVSNECIEGKNVVNPTSGTTESVRGLVTLNEIMNVPTTYNELFSRYVMWDEHKYELESCPGK
jgi:hypothetical protein